VEGVAQRSGKPAPAAMVVLVPDDPEANLELFRRDQSDLDGSFALAQVVPGTYTILAIGKWLGARLGQARHHRKLPAARTKNRCARWPQGVYSFTRTD